MTDLSQIYFHRTAEDYPVGVMLKDINPFTACETGVVTAENAPPILTRAFETSISQGHEGWGAWGYEHASGFPELGVGDEMWQRVAMFFPDDFVFQSGHGSFKTLRMGRLKGDGSNAGYLDWQIRNDRNWQSNIEGSDSTGWVVHTGGQVIPGQWAFFEAYAKFHPSQGVMRIWKNGEMFGERRNVDTMRNGSKTNRNLFLTYVNGGALASQSMYFTEMATAIHSSSRDDRQHLSVDAAGNMLIGTAIKDTESPPIDPPPIDPPPSETGQASLEVPGTKITVTDSTVTVLTDKELVVLDG